MNLHVEAVVIAKSHIGKHEVRKTFDLWQTPTIATREILAHKTNADIINAYETWCNNRNPGSYSVTHIRALKEWIEEHKEWDITFYEM